MLFNSYIFILLFLPLSVLGFYLIGARGHHRIAVSWLVSASLFFYSWWNPAYLSLILTSILFNYALGVSLTNAGLTDKSKKFALAFGVSANLGLLGYFKYANFFVDNINNVFGISVELAPIVLPLAISFFTFQQIAYLVDAYQGETKEYNFLHYCLFVTFFPQLIAGPIVHHREMLPQFAQNAAYRFNHEHLAVGLTIFIIGLAKKVILADGVAVYATPVFDVAYTGQTLTFFEAWGGALAYTLQLYFDFSGYSDMAIGLARMFGIRLPLNFHSPYKAINIIEFWHRWHMTLSRFLRDYLYIPLGGSRKGPVRRHANLMATMLLGGLWHGAGWTFVAWGALHGLYLIVNHVWRAFRVKLGHDLRHPGSIMGRASARILTLLAVIVAWVFFRAESFDAAIHVLEGMAGVNGFILPGSAFEQFGWSVRVLLTEMGWRFDNSVNELIQGPAELVWIVALMMIALFFPNTQQIMSKTKPVLDSRVKYIDQSSNVLQWQPTRAWATGIALVAICCLVAMGQISEFLYFQF